MSAKPKQAELAEVVPPEASLTAPEHTDVQSLLRHALDKGVSVETMEKLVSLHERVADRQAAQEFAAALAQFQDTVPPIERKTTANVATSSGVTYSYRYAELDEIVRTIQPVLRQNALSFTWDSRTEGENLSCTCTLRHVNGHKIDASFQCSTKSRAGMSEPQKAAAALTFAKRQALIQVLGLTTCDPDTDAEDVTAISEDQAKTIREMMRETGANEARFLKIFSVGKVEELTQSNYTAALNLLEAKRRKV